MVENEFLVGQTFVGKLETAKLRKMTIIIYNNNPYIKPTSAFGFFVDNPEI